MTTRITVSLPDDVHASLVRLADASHISASAVVRAILADVLPKMTSVLDYLGTVTPEQAPAVAQQLDAWATEMRTVMGGAPEALGDFRKMLDQPSAFDETAPDAGDER